MAILECPSLVGRHVSLEPLRPEHAPALVEAANQSRTTYAFTLVPEDLASMQSYIETALAEHERGQSVPFVVRDGAGTVAGSTRFMAIEWWPPLANAEVRATPDALEIGHTWYAERVQRTALNTEAKILLCTQAFERWGVRRVRWKTHVRNARSRAAILRLGAQFDGILRATGLSPDGSVRDSAFYSLVAVEWPEARARLLERGAPRLRGVG